MSRIPARVITDVLDRAAGYCEACGGPWALSTDMAFHHRLPRSAGGTDTVANLMWVHGGFRLNCHNLTEYSIHQNPTRSYRLHHLLRRGEDPTLILPVVCPQLRTVRA